jgi:pilus assembly protein CpaE
MVQPGSLNGSPLLAIDTDESVRVLRQAVDTGARGFFVWPSDRAELAAAASRTRDPKRPTGVRRGTVIGVYGPRGGVGTTFVATHLAAALASGKRETILVDADLAFGDLTWALGVPPDAEVRTLGDLDPVRDEITEEHVRNVLWTHASGVRAVLAPPDPSSALDQERLSKVIDAAARCSDAVVVHLPRSPEALGRGVVRTASIVIVVVSLDVSAFRAARRALESQDGSVRYEIVVNRAQRGAITPADVERVFGKPPLCVLPCDRGVGSAQDRGELVPARSRLGRAVRRLATTLLEEGAA